MLRALADPKHLRVILKIVAISAMIGAAFGLIIGEVGVKSAFQGLMTGAFISAPLAIVEFGFLRSRAGERIIRSLFLIHVAAKAAIYLAAAILGVVAADALLSRSFIGSGADGHRFVIVIFVSFAMALLFSFAMTLRAMLGPNVLASFITGRYHTPREERRVFLFADMEGSTAIGERLGPVRFHLLLRRFMYDVGDAVFATEGEIHKYVGDEVIVTWTEEQAASGLPILCVQRIREKVEQQAAAYLLDFGIVPRFWAALHGGVVIAGELGGWKQEIAYIGDVVNTTARIADACRTTGRRFLASRQTVEAMRIPPGFRLEPLGRVPLRGKTEALELVALDPV